MGGVDAVLEKVQASIDAGDLRWAAQVLDHAVFAAPERDDVRLLQADVLEQLGYRAESGPWRDFYLTGAQELRHGAPHLGGSLASSVDVLRAMTTEMLVDLMAVRLDGVRAHPLLLNLTVTDTRRPRRGRPRPRRALASPPGVTTTPRRSPSRSTTSRWPDS